VKINLGKVGNILQQAVSMKAQQMINVPEILLRKVINQRLRAEITVTEYGIMQGIEVLEKKACELGMQVNIHVRSGSALSPGQKIASLTGNPMQILQGEDSLLSVISKPSGIATMARKAAEQADRKSVV
jgi:nicotinate-nucleotide pyrophosphorylase (carboxylating)